MLTVTLTVTRLPLLVEVIVSICHSPLAALSCLELAYIFQIISSLKTIHVIQYALARFKKVPTLCLLKALDRLVAFGFQMDNVGLCSRKDHQSSSPFMPSQISSRTLKYVQLNYCTCTLTGNHFLDLKIKTHQLYELKRNVKLLAKLNNTIK